MNILIKLMSIVSLVIAPTLAKIHADKIQTKRDVKIKTLQAMPQVNAAHTSVYPTK
jgi:K(+)-stimulated pyrophosphate-energized sodium pump